MLSMTAVAALEEDSVEVAVEENVEVEEEEAAVAALYSSGVTLEDSSKLTEMQLK